MDAPPVVTPDLFVHVRIVMSIVVGFGLTRLLGLVGRLVQHPARTPIYWVHLVWVASLFIGLMHFWWWEFALASQAWTFELYVFVVFYASLYYLMAVLLAPDDVAEYTDFADYFLSRRKWFFGLFALAALVDVADTALKGSAYLANHGLEYFIATAVTVLLSLLAIVTPNRRFQAAFAVLNIVYQVTYILRLYDTFE